MEESLWGFMGGFRRLLLLLLRFVGLIVKVEESLLWLVLLRDDDHFDRIDGGGLFVEEWCELLFNESLLRRPCGEKLSRVIADTKLPCDEFKSVGYA